MNARGWLAAAWLCLSCGLAIADSSAGLPLEPARKIQFTTDEATWSSLDVTPDGRWIVFDMLGDLYRLSIGGGKAERITEGLAYDCQPRVSPDGKWLAFVSDRDGIFELWIKSLVGTELRKLAATTLRAVGTGGEYPVAPVWSPDGRRVLARSADSGKLTFYDIEGRPPVALQGGLNTEPFPEAVFDPRGRYLYGPKGRQIVRWDLETGEETAVTQMEVGAEAYSPLISPRGDLLIYASNDYYDPTRILLHRLDLEAAEERIIGSTDYKESVVSYKTRLPGYAFTPDGKTVLIATRGKVQRIEVASGKSSTIPFTADVSLEIGPALDFKHRIEKGPVKARIVQDPQLSPDGKRLVFSVLTKLYTMALPDGAPKRLTASDAWEYKPAWSPDGKWIVYVTWSAEGGHIWKMCSSGKGSPQRLTSRSAFYTSVSFSADGRMIFAVRDRTNRLERDPTNAVFWPYRDNPDPSRVPVDIIWIGSAGGEPHVVTQVSSMSSAPRFDGATQRVYFYSGTPPPPLPAATGQGTLMSTRLDGLHRRSHFTIVGLDDKDIYYDKTIELSPDGRWALVKVRQQLYVLAVPRVAGTTLSIDVAHSPVPCARLTDIGVDYFSWAEGGKTITWALGSTFSRRSVSSVDFSPTAQRREVSAVARDHDAAVERIPIDMNFPRRTPKGTLVLRHANVITMGASGTIDGADVLVVDNHIAAVGRSGTLSIPAEAKEMDLRGKFILPGFVDTHAHWYTLKRYNLLEPPSWDLMANLAYGVTTSMEVAATADDLFAYCDLAATGQTLAPRLFSTGPPVLTNGPPFLSYYETFQYLRRYAEYFHTHYLKAYAPGPRRQSEWMAMAARELGTRITAHPDLGRPFDGYSSSEHFLPTHPPQKDVLELYARTRIGVTPTLIAGRIEGYAEELNLREDPKFNRFAPPNFIAASLPNGTGMPDFANKVRRQGSYDAAQVQRAGGLIGVGSHGNFPGIQYHMEMWALGISMPPAEVLRAATLDGARILGLDLDVGSIEPGKLADLVVLDKNPLENLRNTNSIRYVMRNGELYDGETLAEVWPEHEPAPSFWWHRLSASP